MPDMEGMADAKAGSLLYGAQRRLEIVRAGHKPRVCCCWTSRRPA